MKTLLIGLSLFVIFGVAGCRGSVEPTEDSVRVEADVPKVEVGDAPVDLDPRTDRDIDVDTPAPGDK